MLDTTTKKQLLDRLGRAEGQLAAIKRMIDRETDCADVLLQIAAVQGALGKAGQILLGFHIEHCVKDAFLVDDERVRQRKVEELMAVFARFGGVSR
jgi:CsoR family transcriptional regulator, copper-sensing transcriptional repressor